MFLHSGSQVSPPARNISNTHMFRDRSLGKSRDAAQINVTRLSVHEFLLADKRCVRNKTEDVLSCRFSTITLDQINYKLVATDFAGILKQESRAIAKKPRDGAAVRCGLKFTDIHTTSLQFQE